MIEFLVAGLFADHMVLQQKRANPLWGWDKPGQVLRLSIEGARKPVAPVEAKAGPDGRWVLLCPELPAGGPYRLHIQGSEEQVIDDVEVGEVWLAAGQSNMEWGLANTVGGQEEIKVADNPEIRCFKMPHHPASAPLANTGGEWVRVSPRSAGGMTAVGYYFAKRLQQELKVPVGIISDNWGGTRLEAWVRPEGLKGVMDVSADMGAMDSQLAKLPELMQAFNEKVAAWEAKNLPADPGNVGEAQGWALPGFDDSGWDRLRVPGSWQSQGVGYDRNGAVWYRRSVEIPAGLEGRDLLLTLGQVDDFDSCYYNGEKVGGVAAGTPGAASLERRYTVPGRLVKAGRALVAVRVFDQSGEGGILGPGYLVGLQPVSGDEARLRLAGEWRAHKELEVSPSDKIDWGSAPWPSFPREQERLGSLYNGMIAPLQGYGLRGVLWYQGESNTDKARIYGACLRALIRDWRGLWGQGDFPFYLVQLPNLRADPSWPRMREQQEQVLSEPGTGMAVLIDSGDPANIHPKTKRVVGERLARVALADTYGIAGLESSGPRRESVEIHGAEVRVHFSHAKGLACRDGASPRAFELAAVDGVFHPAQARIEGEAVILVSPEVPLPAFVRYAFSDNPDVNLQNSEGFPAIPFRTDAF